MPQTTGVAIVATHLAITDRRALSQAWYSALHLAERATAAPRVRPSARVAPWTGAIRQAPPERGPATHAGVAVFVIAQRDAARERGGGVAPATERRRPTTELAHRIERALARQVRRGSPSSFAVRAGDGRVHLLVRSDGARTRVVAVCAASVRERVDRALAHARFALAAAGLRPELG